MARIISPSGKGGSGAPSGVYADIAALGAAYPVGNKNVYVTLDDGNWNYWNGTAWAPGGVYLSNLPVVNNLTDGGDDVPLSAEMGKELDEIKADKLTASNYTPGNILVAGEGGIYIDSGYPVFMDVITDPIYIQNATRKGNMRYIADVGDSFEVSRGSDILTFDFIGFDADTPADTQFTHSTTVQLHDCYKSLQYDAVEALYYAEEELAAGAYNFTLLAGYDLEYGGGKTYYFTLAQPVPAGGQILFPWGYQIQAATIKISTYASRTSAVAIETVSVIEGTDGTPINITNHTHRIRYGSNNYAESALRQLLNSNAAAGSIWFPKTIYDRPPTWAETEAGFLNGLDTDFLSVLGAPVKRTAKNTVSDGGGYNDLSTDIMFLLSRGEVGGLNENNINEGIPYEYYANMLTSGARNDGEIAGRIKYLSGTARRWWLRSPYTSSSCSVRGVSTSGSVSDGIASGAHDVAPACCVI